MNNEFLNDSNFLIFCARHYNASSNTDEDFFEDMNRIKYIKKLVTRYIETGDLRERLILNHIIILGNVFSPEIVSKILIFKAWEYMEYIKPFLVMLNMLPEKILNTGEFNILDTNTIPMDQKIVEELRKLWKNN